MTSFSASPVTGSSSAVIVLGVDTPIGLAVLRDLGRHNYTTIGIGRSRNSIGFASHYCHVPIIRASDNATLIEQLKELAGRFPSACLVAISEADLLLINHFRAELESQLLVIAPTKKMLEQVLDKDVSISLARQVGIRTPHTFNLSDINTIEQEAEQLTYPRVLKWSDPNKVSQMLSAAGLELRKCDYALTPQELVAKLKPFSKVNQYPMVQEYCAGKGIGQMFLMRQGEVVLQFQHERLHEWPPEGGVSTYCKSIPLKQHKECRERSIALLKLLKWDGVAMVEYRYDSDADEYYFMEINGRFWGSLPLAIAAEVPFAAELVRCSNPSFNQEKQSEYLLLGCRYMIPETRRLLRLLLQPNKIGDPSFRYSKVNEIGDYLISFLKPATRYYLFSFSDLGPFLRDIKNGLKKVVKRGG